MRSVGVIKMMVLCGFFRLITFLRFSPAPHKPLSAPKKREDSELLDGPLRSQGSLDTLARPQNTGVRDQNPGGLTREKVSISQLPGFDLDELLDGPFRSHGRCATEATVQNNSEMDTCSTCHNRENVPGPAQTTFDVQKRRETDILFLSWTSV